MRKVLKVIVNSVYLILVLVITIPCLIVYVLYDKFMESLPSFWGKVKYYCKLMSKEWFWNE